MTPLAWRSATADNHCMRAASTLRLLLLISLLASVWPVAVAQATSITANGMSFSDEGGGFRLVSVSGTGSRADPFVVVEEFTGPEAAIMVVRGMDNLLKVGEPSHGTIALQAAGFTLRKVVINLSGTPWQIFDMELREDLAVPSDYHDGLSFDQINSAPRPFHADRFALSEEVSEPFDYIQFSQGTVRQGETVTFDVTITDTSPNSLFFLIQRPRRPIADDSHDDRHQFAARH